MSSQPSYNRGNKAPVNFFGAFSTVLLSVALLCVSMRSSNRACNYTDALRTNDRPEYYEIYKHKEVIGVSILFMVVDMMGGVFSDLSLAFKDKFDVVAGITYSLFIVRLASTSYSTKDTEHSFFRYARCLTLSSWYVR